MTETTVYVRAPRAKVRHIIEDIPLAARQGGHADDILINAGTAALKRIRNAFLVKSRGGTDETGERWAPLARTTLLRKARKRNQTGDAYRPSVALSTEQRDLWWAMYRSALARFHDKSIAAKIAWSRTKRLIGAIPFDKYGTASRILRDTDALLESFQPGAAHNIFRIKPGEAEFGTDRPGAKAHHLGAKNLPRRRLWPEPNDWTSEWWQEVLDGARAGLIQLLIEELK